MILFVCSSRIQDDVPVIVFVIVIHYASCLTMHVQSKSNLKNLKDMEKLNAIVIFTLVVVK